MVVQWQGSAHDATIWYTSAIWAKIYFGNKFENYVKVQVWNLSLSSSSNLSLSSSLNLSLSLKLKFKFKT